MSKVMREDPEVQSKRVIAWLGGATAFLGVLGMFAWVTGLYTLSSLSSHFIPMAPYTALFFMFFGGYLIA
jgi:hypothetical protein